jgi:hypothetical protein
MAFSNILSTTSASEPAAAAAASAASPPPPQPAVIEKEIAPVVIKPVEAAAAVISPRQELSSKANNQQEAYRERLREEPVVEKEPLHPVHDEPRRKKSSTAEKENEIAMAAAQIDEEEQLSDLDDPAWEHERQIYLLKRKKQAVLAEGEENKRRKVSFLTRVSEYATRKLFLTS